MTQRTQGTPGTSGTPVAPGRPTTRLGCGRDIDDVWAHIDGPPDEHEQQCEYCQQARRDLESLTAATRDMVDADRSDPDLHVSTGAMSALMDIVRTEVRRGRSIPLLDEQEGVAGGQPGELAVSEVLLGSVVRDASDRHPDVEARRVRITVAQGHASSTPPESSGLRPSDVVVDMDVTVRSGASIPEVTRELREEIAAAVRDRVGVTAGTISIHVTDLIEPASTKGDSRG